MEVDIKQSESFSSEGAQEVRFRCPHCQKLYCTNSNVFDGDVPVFDCMACHKSFKLTQNRNEFGLYQAKTMSDMQMVCCPKCSFLKPQKMDECPSCGVLASKYEAIQKTESPSLFELNQQWQKVIAAFENDQVHQNFIGACQRKMALNFAFKKYSDLKQTVGFNTLCEKYMKQIEVRLEQQLQQDQQNTTETQVEKKYWNLTQTQWIFLLSGLTGTSLLLFNKIHPLFPNLNGLIVAMTLLSFGLVFVASDKLRL